jgi:hypothetical protein
MPVKKTTEQFVTKAQIIHGNKYDYSLVEYKNIETKVKIKCKLHGEWEQTPHAHLKGHGCFKCGRDGLRSSTNEFVKKAKIIHSDKYDYSLVEYKNAGAKIKIICSEHGEFKQSPGQHLLGQGCLKCANFALKKTTKQFIEEAKKIHNDLYDYSLVKYIGINNKVKIICSKHGEFEQTPSIHLSGSGCKKCIEDEQRKTTEQFIEEAVEVHGDKYDYYLSDYKGARKNITIFCRFHGEFKQVASSHLAGKGCPFCVNKTEGKIKQFLEENNIIYETQYKVDTKKFDFLIDKKYILEIDGAQHFPCIKKQNLKFNRNPIDNLNNDIRKTKSIITKYPIVRLFQENIWNDNYDWKDLIKNHIIDLESNTLYIRFAEKDLYKDHISGFITEYFSV